MKFLITGGAGFLGANLASEVLKRGEELCVIDTLARTGGDSNLAWLRQTSPFEFHAADVRDHETLQRIVGDFGPEVIFHLAGQVAMTTSIADPRLDFTTNALGTFNVLEAGRLRAPESLIIYSSTNKVYGDLEWLTYEEMEKRYRAVGYESGFDETLPLDFRSPYGCSKGAADQYVLDYARVFGMKTVVFRHSSMYGERQFATYDQGWIGWFCQQAIANARGDLDGAVTISGNGKQVRDLIHVRDVVALYFAVAEQPEAMAGRALNVGGGTENSLSLLELFDLLHELVGARFPIEELPPRQSDQKVFVCNNARVKELLGCQPSIGWKAGVTRMVEWLEQIYD